MNKVEIKDKIYDLKAKEKEMVIRAKILKSMSIKKSFSLIIKQNYNEKYQAANNLLAGIKLNIGNLEKELKQE